MPDGDVAAALAMHTAGPDGWCAGCLDGWARLSPTPCPIARELVSQLETGVSVWDSVAGNGLLDVTACLACEGRGWKFTTSRVRGLWKDCRDELIRRSCVDCGGEGVVRHG
jgi:hypothetical protein